MNVNNFDARGTGRPSNPTFQSHTAYTPVAVTPLEAFEGEVESVESEDNSGEHCNSPTVTPRIQVFASRKHKPENPASIRSLFNSNFMAVQIKPSPVGLCIICLSMVIILYYMFRSSDISTSSSISVRELLSASVDLAERGGREVVAVKKEHGENQKSKGETKEGANDPVTDGDYRSHVQIISGLRKAFPRLHIVSEEHDQSKLDLSKVELPDLHLEEVSHHTNFDEIVPVDELTVWVDPLDATQEYTEDLLQYVTVMVCIARKGVPIAGVVHKPFEQKSYWAYAGSGLSPILIRQSNADTSKKNIIVSRSHKGTVEETVKDRISNSEVIPAGGAGYKVLSLFEGKADAYVHTTLIKKWDICAGNALLTAVGGKMTTLGGDTISYHYSDNPKNEGGLLATLTNHDQYLKAMEGVMHKR